MPRADVLIVTAVHDERAAVLDAAEPATRCAALGVAIFSAALPDGSARGADPAEPVAHGAAEGGGASSGLFRTNAASR
jgi:hypothetical protein